MKYIAKFGSAISPLVSWLINFNGFEKLCWFLWNSDRWTCCLDYKRLIASESDIVSASDLLALPRTYENWSRNELIHLLVFPEMSTVLYLSSLLKFQKSRHWVQVECILCEPLATRTIMLGLRSQPPFPRIPPWWFFALLVISLVPHWSPFPVLRLDQFREDVAWTDDVI